MRTAPRAHGRSRQRVLVTFLVAAVTALAATAAVLAAPPPPPPPMHHPMPAPPPGGPQFGSGDNGAAGSSGSAQQVNQGHGGKAAELTSVGYGYGLVSVSFPKKATFSQLTNLATDYTLTQGVCSGGSPRFQVDLLPPGDKNLGDAISFYVYFGTQPYGGCPTGGPQSQPNVASATSTAGWWLVTSSVSNAPETYSAAEAQYGSYQLLDAQIAVDGGWAQTGNTQQVLVNNWMVDNKTYFPAPKPH